MEGQRLMIGKPAITPFVCFLCCNACLYIIQTDGDGEKGESLSQEAEPRIGGDEFASAALGRNELATPPHRASGTRASVRKQQQYRLYVRKNFGGKTGT